MTTIPVTTITVNASRDNLTEDVYRDIYTELREKYSLRDFVALAESTVSIAQWSRYEKGQWTLTRQARQDLRRAVGLPLLPLTILESVQDVDPDAEVYAIGDKPKNRVFLASKGDNLSISVNGVVSARLSPCTSRTRPIRKRLRRDMSEQQAKVWDGLTEAQRNERLGL